MFVITKKTPPPANLSKDEHDFVISCREILEFVLKVYESTGKYPEELNLEFEFEEKFSVEDFRKLRDLDMLKANYSLQPTRTELTFFGFLYCSSEEAKKYQKSMEDAFNFLMKTLREERKEVDLQLDDFCRLVNPKLGVTFRQFWERLLAFFNSEPFVIFTISWSGSSSDAGKVYYSVCPRKRIREFKDFSQYLQRCYELIKASRGMAEPSALIGDTFNQEKAPAKLYVNEKRILELKNIKSTKFDLSKTAQILEEINRSFKYQNYLSIILLLRMLIDHIPPIFEMETFKEVANAQPISVKKTFLRFDEHVRNVADHYIHQKIRKKEHLPNDTQIDFRSELDFLLGEVIRTLHEKS